ncbi:MAG: RNA-binding transcriptional accessory protein [Gammaproteobacteria bacterium]|nr:RNA-binding transcriptional accessory protein [Gammaproteobacteria bacterium]
MAEYITEKLIENIAENLGIKKSQVEATLKLLEEGGTIPFIARYRKEVTGSLDENEIKEISKEYEYGQALNKRKEDVMRLIDEKGMLTDELKKEIEDATKLITLEDIYRPFKEKKKTKATEAIKAGLEPYANWVMSFPKEGDPYKEAKKYVNDLAPSEDKVIEGAMYIIAEKVSDEKEYREYIREKIMERGIITSSKKKNAVDEKETYRDYYEYSERISTIKSYRTLALNRAEKEKVITVSIECDRDYLVNYLKRKVNKKPDAVASFIIDNACEDSFDRLIFPSIEREIRSILSDQAEDDAIKLFGVNLENLLLTAPIKGKMVLGVDPGFRTGCKVAALDRTGKVLGKGLIEQNQRFPEEKVPEERITKAKNLITNVVRKYKIDIIAIGNGTASRETEKFIAETIKENNLPCKYVIVSEAGASVYSASKVAQEEFPDFHVEERSAVSIGRRIQDPLAELVKIDPKSIGVGQYQHDVTESKLSDTLDFVVEKAVNEVGVDINTASKSLLQYVSGLNKTTAQSIVTYREENGEFKSREQLKKVPKIGDKAFEQAAGFLRVPESSNPFDKTPIHPESYDIAKQILKYLGFTENDLGSNDLIRKVNSTDQAKVAKELNISEVLVEDIFKAFIAPNRDPRDELPQPILKSDLLTLEDLKPGMKLEGTVRNITDFGAFVDVGIHESGLVHISKMAKRRIAHPSEILKVGDIVEVWVVDTDLQRKRLALTMVNPAE